MFIATGSNTFIKPFRQLSETTWTGIVHSVGLNGTNHVKEDDCVIYHADDLKEITLVNGIVLHVVLYYLVCGKEIPDDSPTEFEGFDVF